MLKKYITTRSLLLAAASTALVLPASGAFAISSSGLAALIRSEHTSTRARISSEHEQTRTDVVNSIEQQTTDLNDHLDIKVEELIEALKGQARENSNYQQMQVEAAQRVEDAAQVNNTNRLKDEFRAKAESGEFDPNPYSCMLIDMFGTGSTSGGSGGSSGSEITQAVDSWVAGEHEAIQQGGSALSQYVYNQSQEYEGYGGSDHASTDFGLLVDDPTIDLSDADMSAVTGLVMRNLIDSTPPRKESDPDLATPAGIDRYAKREETKARMSAAAKSQEMAINMRTAVMEGDAVEAFRDMAEDSAYNRGTDFEKLSELQQLDIMTVWNYAPKGERAEKLTDSSMSEKAWLFELHRVMSLNTRINYLQLELMNRDAIVNAGILATMNDDS